MRGITLLITACCFIAGAALARAEVNESDLVIAARALSFMERPPSGEVRVGIVYAPDNPQSAEEAGQLQKMLGSGLKVGNLVLKSVMVKIADAAAADVGLFFLTDGVGAAAAKLADDTRAKQIPCVTTDIAQVQSGACVMGVRSSPKIEILINRAAAAASGTVFSTAFRMMITEL